jgi:hypothetical protein
MLAFAVLATACVARTPAAHAENWQYRVDLGGWLDNETGLVWGPPSQTWINASFQWSPDAAQFYRNITGNPLWRLPTLAEFQTAYSHNAWAYFSQTSDYWGAWWTSTAGTGKDKKSAWAMMSIKTGKTALHTQTSAMGIMTVYRP